ncbi:beta-1,3-glucanase family protein [Microbacterium rhizomatis]|nr:beta-1,3-glucanase family protein [Microbacterium rhizomatis]
MAAPPERTVATPPTVTGPNHFPVQVVNDTGVWDDSDIWLTVIGLQDGQWSYQDAAGKVLPMNSADAAAPGHFTKDDVDYAAMSFPLPVGGGTVLNGFTDGGSRVYVSLGAPMYIAIAPDSSGFTIPVVTDPSNPNHDGVWDYYEYAFEAGSIAYGGDVDMVDAIGFPMTAELEQQSTGISEYRGITATLADVREAVAALGGGYADLVQPNRILNPANSPTFLASPEGTAMNSAVDEAWAAWAAGFSYTEAPYTFTGRVEEDGKLHLQTTGPNETGAVVLPKPTAAEVFSCGAAFSPGDINGNLLGSRLCAAFNRGIALQQDAWFDTADYYPPGAVANRYSQVIHELSAHGLAYGFPYDDVNSQGSISILPNTDAPSALTLTLGRWDVLPAPAVDK